jgi:quercetin dioxygenase-like cupin family protein
LKGELDVELGIHAASAAELAARLGDAERVTLIDSPALFVGIKRFQPGEVFANHYHDGYDEFFATLTGELSIWVARSSKVSLPAGGSLLCPRGVQHRLANEGTAPAALLFAKVPLIADDTIPVDWSPEQS